MKFAALALALLTFGCAPRNQTDARTRTASQLIGAEQEIWASVTRKDRSAMERLLAPEYRYLSADGQHDRTRAEELDFRFGGRVRLDSVQFEHWRAVWQTDDAVVLHYTSVANGTIDGKPGARRSGAMVAWVRRSGAWQAVARTEWPLEEATATRATPIGK